MSDLLRGRIVDAMVRGRPDEVIALCADLNEVARADLTDALDAVAAELTPAPGEQHQPGGLDEVRLGQLQARDAAALCTGPPAAPRSGLAPFRRLSGELVRRGVAGRSRQWRDEWVQHWARWVKWPDLRQLMRDGVIDRPRTDDYGQWLARAMTGRWSNWTGSSAGVYESLLADPDLLEDDVFLIFGVGSLLQYRGTGPAIWQQWAPALLRLEAEGRIDRGRLLDASLAGVEQHPLVGAVRAFAVFHGKLKPTLDELAGREQAQLRLLESEAAPAVALGLRQLARLQRAGRADQQELLESIQAAVAATAPGIARNAVRLIGDVIAREPGLAEDGLTAALPALTSPDPETQSAVLDLLERHGDTVSGRSQLAARLSRVDPSLRSRAARLCGHADAVTASDAPAVTVPDPEPLDPWMIPRLNRDAVITPITTVDELLDVTAVVLERQDDPDELERWCDGVARLCDQPLDERRVKPLVRRARNVIPAEMTYPDLVTARFAVSQITHQWLTGEPLGREHHHGRSTYLLKTDAGPRAALNRRLAALAERAANRDARPLLSAPTHRGAWIDPAVLADRLAQSINVDDEDLAQALLRIPPGSHDATRARVAPDDGEATLALRAALGDPQTTPPEDPALPASWDAVAVVRGSTPATMQTPLPGPVPIRSRLDPPPPPPVTPRVCPVRTLTLAAPVDTFPGDLNTRHWLALTFPGDLAPYCGYVLAHYRLAEIERVYWMTVAEQETIGPGLEPLLAPDTPLGLTATQLLAAALGATTTDRILAAEVVIAAIADRRLDSAALGTAIADAMRSPRAVPDRWADGLANVPPVSALHAHEIQRVLEATLNALGAEMLRLPNFVNLLRQLVEAAGARVQLDGARRWLEAAPPRSKLGRNARAALAVTGGGSARSLAAAQAAQDAEEAQRVRWAPLGDASLSR